MASKWLSGMYEYDSYDSFRPLNLTNMITQVSVYPNPFSSSLSFEIVVQTDESTLVRMLDQNEKIVKLMSWSLKTGTNKTSFEGLQALPAGNYFVDITSMDGKNLFNTKLVKL